MRVNVGLGARVRVKRAGSGALRAAWTKLIFQKLLLFPQIWGYKLGLSVLHTNLGLFSVCFFV